MPRAARKKSESGIYHVVLRGINRQQIFNDSQDNRYFLHRLNAYRDSSGYKVYAYCLMGNHVHLLMKEEYEPLSNAFRRIGASYVYWYNWKYGRDGHLFQDRFRSEPVETDKYFLTAIRYIHQNPIKAGITGKMEEYPWSSYREYIKKAVICDTDYALSFFGDKRNRALPRWIEFHREENQDRLLEIERGKRRSDEEAAELIKKITGLSNPVQLKFIEKQRMRSLLRSLREQNLPIRQIERLTGISFAVIRKA